MSDRACEFPSVAPMASGKPHKHAYLAGSRVMGETNWGPPQVSYAPFYSHESSLHMQQTCDKCLCPELLLIVYCPVAE